VSQGILADRVETANHPARSGQPTTIPIYDFSSIQALDYNA
jgi:hypothetical protein